MLVDLPIFWKRLYDEQAMVAAVVESYEPPTCATIVAFGASVFVTDTFTAEARAGSPISIWKLSSGSLRTPI